MSSPTEARSNGRSASGGGPSTAVTPAAPPAGSTTKELLSSALQARVASNNYIVHLKIWEGVVEAGVEQRKARYLILAVQRDTGRVTINKAKRNANGSFSIGKDWDLNQLREIVVEKEDTFALALTRTYSWQTERPRDQTLFLQSVVKVYRKYTGEQTGPACVGLELAPASKPSNGATPTSSTAAAPAPTPTSARAIPPINTTVQRQVSRESPSSARPPRSAHDGFYDPVNRDVISSSPASITQPIPTITTTDDIDSHGSLAAKRSLRRPPIDRQASAQAVMTPAADQESTSTFTQPQKQASLSKGASPKATTKELDTPEAAPVDKAATKVGRSPSRVAMKLAAAADRISTPTRDRAETPTRKESIPADSVPTRQPAEAKRPVAPSPKSANRPVRPPQSRNRSSNSNISSLSAPGAGDARARLSSIEPVRGGAAYEKMLLAGTGLTGVAEDDDGEEDNDEDAYGGAEISDANEPDILPRSTIADERKRRSKHMAAEAKKNELNADDDEDTILANVEEMLEGFEFQSKGGNRLVAKVPGQGTADIIEARLLNELAALDAANIHAIIESDDRVNLVMQHMEEAMRELDMIDSMVAGYKMQLNGRADDISHIESQNRGLQVQTSNQRALSAEIEKLLSTVHVDESAIGALLHSDMHSDEGIGELESAGAALYKAMLQASRTRDDSQRGDPATHGVAAASERLEEYSVLADRFAKRLLDFLTGTFNDQTYAVLHDAGRQQAIAPPNPTLADHSMVERVLGRYCGLLLYAKEVSPTYFSRISAAYFASASERYKGEMTRMFGVCKESIARVSEDDVAEASFVPMAMSSSGAALRTGTIRRPLRGGGNRAVKTSQGEMTGAEAFARVLSAVTPLVAREQTFISDLLHINSNAITFADYMDLEAYFRRRAVVVFGGSATSASVKSMRDSLDLVFGFLATEWQGMIDEVIGRDKTQIVGILAALDRGLLEAEEVNSEYLLRSLSKMQMRLAAQLERYIAEQIRGIEQTKLTAKKRKGVVHFIKAFPHFAARVEEQMVNTETLQIRAVVDTYYDKLCSAMFDALQTMAIPKIEGGTFSTSNTDEDKGLLNHHVILIENMHHVISGITRIQSTRGTAALAPQLKRAQGIMADALHAYVQSTLRRPLAKMMDFSDGVDGLLRSTPAHEVSLHSAYSKQAAKRLTKEYNSKDIRKSVEALARRVQKHFDEDEITSLVDSTTGGANVFDASGISAEEIIGLLGLVWREVEDGFTRECERLVRILRECYTNNEARLLAEFTMEDVRRPFASNSPAARRR